jgi:hypothetical protein
MKSQNESFIWQIMEFKYVVKCKPDSSLCRS